MKKRAIKGRLEVVCGCMFSGKSEALIQFVRRSQIAQLKTSVFKPRIDDRFSLDYMHTYNGEKIKAIAVDNASDIELFITDNIQVIVIDEVHFFTEEIVPVLLGMVDRGIHVFVGGLDLDFRGRPFGCMPALMAIADSVRKLNAVCVQCGNEARFSQRLINGKAAKYDDPIILINKNDYYEARCRDCYFISKNGLNEHQALNA